METIKESKYKRFGEVKRGDEVYVLLDIENSNFNAKTIIPTPVLDVMPYGSKECHIETVFGCSRSTMDYSETIYNRSYTLYTTKEEALICLTKSIDNQIYAAKNMAYALESYKQQVIETHSDPNNALTDDKSDE